MRDNATMFFLGLLVVVTTTIGFLCGYAASSTAERQSTVPVACEPAVKGLKRNGKEMPLTSAQRDSLSFRR